jgi:hypothetical protein
MKGSNAKEREKQAMPVSQQSYPRRLDTVMPMILTGRIAQGRTLNKSLVG